MIHKSQLPKFLLMIACEHRLSEESWQADVCEMAAKDIWDSWREKLHEPDETGIEEGDRANVGAQEA